MSSHHTKGAAVFPSVVWKSPFDRIPFLTVHEGLSCTIATIPRQHHAAEGEFAERKREEEWKGALHPDFPAQGSFPVDDQKGVQTFVSGERVLSDWVIRTVLVWSST